MWVWFIFYSEAALHIEKTVVDADPDPRLRYSQKQYRYQITNEL